MKTMLKRGGAGSGQINQLKSRARFPPSTLVYYDDDDEYYTTMVVLVVVV